MACGIRLASGERSLNADSLTGTPVWLMAPQPCAGLLFIDAVAWITNRVGNAQVRVVVEFFATDPNTPTSRVTVGTDLSSTAKLWRDCTAEAAVNAFFRVGLVPTLSTGTTPGSIGVSLTGTAKMCGGVLSRESLSVGPMPANVQRVVELTDRFPAREWSTVQAVVRVIGKGSATGGNLRTRLMARTYTTDPREANTWTPLEAWSTVTAPNGERLMAAVSPALAPNTNAWGQLGLALEATTNDVSATVVVLLMGAK